MSIITFFIILSVLVLVHEFGHFLTAKFFGVRVDEFGLGYPPRAKKIFRLRGTDFTLNWLPFGGFVKIFGENPSEETAKAPESFQNKSKGIQALVLVAGVVFNFLFAWILISIGFMTGLPAPTGLNLPIENPQIVITTVIPNSPATLAGLKSGDTILSLENAYRKIPDMEETLSPEAASQFISTSLSPVTFEIKRGKTISHKVVTPEDGIVADRPAIGISMEVIGTVILPAPQALWQGLKTTTELTVLTAKALGQFILQALGGRADLSEVTGPVGLVGMVGDVEELGFNHLMAFTAIISINLCLINLLPFPALDGGRLIFVGLEAISRRQVPSRIFNAINAAGFAFLIFLMIIITIRDVRNIL